MIDLHYNSNLLHIIFHSDRAIVIIFNYRLNDQLEANTQVAAAAEG